MQILVIDQNTTEREFIVNKLEEATPCRIYESDKWHNIDLLISKYSIDLLIAATDSCSIDIVNKVKAQYASVQIILISNICNTHEAVDAIKAGVYDFVLKNNTGISRLIKRVWEVERHINAKKNIPSVIASETGMLTCQSQDNLAGFMERYRLFFKHMVNGAALYKAVVGADGDIVDFVLKEVNPSFIKFTGLDETQLQNVSLSDIMRKLEDSSFESKLKSYANVTKTGINEEFIHYSKGLNRYFKVFAFRPCAGYLASIAEDVTMQRNMEEQLREQRRKALNIIEGTIAGTWEWNIKSDQIQINSFWKKRLGYEHNELCDLNRSQWEQLIHPEEREAVVNVVDRFINKEIDHFDVEFQQQRKDGSWLWANARGKIVEHNLLGNPALVAGTLIDVSKKKQLELQLQENEQRLQTIFDHAPATMFVVNGKGKVLKVNQTAIECNDFSDVHVSSLRKGDIVQCANARSSVEGCGTTSFCADCELRTFLLHTIKPDSQKTSHEISLLVNSQGKLERKYYLASASLLSDYTKENYLVTLVDISAQKKTEHALEESNASFKQLSEQSSEGIIIHKGGVIVNANEAISNIVGYSKEEMHLRAIKGGVPEKYHGLLDVSISQDVTDTFEIEIIHKDGYLIPVEVKSRWVSLEDNDLRVATIRDVREKKQLQENIAKAAIKAEEKERQRLSQELHDGLGPLLSMTKMLNQAYLKTINPIQRRKLSSQLNANIEAALKHNSELSRNLYPQLLKDFGLESAVEQMLKNIKIASGIKCFGAFNIKSRLPQVIEFTFYRIIAELINNTIKHANASCINIEVNEQANVAVLSFYNDGHVFDFDTIKEGRNGMGLFNIYNRVKALNGNIAFEAKKELGISYTIELPLNLDNLSN
ncbi:PAS domain S-box protein [Carboxylicivirga sp. RSCT41]|uniref:PAS domain-containing sensor histidine kinase n=1 Tax=Carboxylicivirga agarovorans TaxID=3417570 RepID=UPI003D34A53C